MRRRHRKHANPFTVRHEVAPLDELAVFGREAPLALDIGCGRGAFPVELARRRPAWNVLGLEIREHLVAMTLERARRLGVTNVHAIFANANLHLERLVRDRKVVFVSINFPDPWFKKRHHKRRVLNHALLDVLSRKVLPGAELHAMTDHEELALEMLARLEERSELENLAGPGRFAEASTTGIATERERKHMERGSPIYRIHVRWLTGDSGRG